MQRNNNNAYNNNNFNSNNNMAIQHQSADGFTTDSSTTSGYSGGYSSYRGSTNNRANSKGGRSNKSWGKKPMARTNVTNNSASSSKPPPGQYLSKVASDVTNDPLSEKAYFSTPSEEYRRVADREHIYSGCEIFPILCEQTYIKASCLSPAYGKTVPKSAHDYYIGVLITYRLLHLERMNGRYLTYDEEKFIDQVQSSPFSVPKSVNLYLSGFGNTKIPKGRELDFKMYHPELTSHDVIDGSDSWRIPGYFGSMEDGVGYYASYPATGVLAQRILEDLRKTANDARPAAWDLPADIRFTGHALNANCLGYAPAKKLSPEQKRFFDDANVLETLFEFDNNALALNMELMTAVHQKLMYTKQALYPLPTSLTGSVGQLCVEVVCEQTTTVAMKTTFVGQTNFEVPSAEGYLGGSFMYNMDKDYERLSVIKSLLPVSFRINDAVPIHIRESLNYRYSHSSRTLRIRAYETIGFSPSIRMECIVKLDSATNCLM